MSPMPLQPALSRTNVSRCDTLRTLMRSSNGRSSRLKYSHCRFRRWRGRGGRAVLGVTESENHRRERGNKIVSGKRHNRPESDIAISASTFLFPLPLFLVPLTLFLPAFQFRPPLQPLPDLLFVPERARRVKR